MITQDIKNELYTVGLDCKEMIEKFMDSEQMFLKFFKKFFDSSDSVVEELRIAVDSNDYAQMENRAHALKGMAGNIGLNAVFTPAQKIVDDMRAQRYTDYKADFEKLQAAYSTAKSISERL